MRGTRRRHRARSRGRARRTGGRPAPDREKAVAGTDGPAAPAAVRVLTRAASAASAGPVPDARPEQYVYVESLVAHAARRADGGSAALPPAHRRQVWLSADGARPGLLREDGAPDSVLDEPGPVYELDHPGATPGPRTLRPAAPSIDRPTPAFLAALPTDPEALLARVHEDTRATAGRDPHQRAFTAIGTLLAETWAPPRVTAALYGAAARIPGTRLLPTATDAAGREGVAVARTGADGEQTQWIFDRRTSAFLGQRTTLTRPTPAGPPGTVLSTTAVLTRGIADHPGARPEHPVATRAEIRTVTRA
ncbi:CU044_5270 family protein [Streptomyces sp. SBR177]